MKQLLKHHSSTPAHTRSTLKPGNILSTLELFLPLQTLLPFMKESSDATLVVSFAFLLTFSINKLFFWGTTSIQYKEQ